MVPHPEESKKSWACQPCIKNPAVSRICDFSLQSRSLPCSPSLSLSTALLSFRCRFGSHSGGLGASEIQHINREGHHFQAFRSLRFEAFSGRRKQGEKHIQRHPKQSQSRPRAAQERPRVAHEHPRRYRKPSLRVIKREVWPPGSRSKCFWGPPCLVFARSRPNLLRFRGSIALHMFIHMFLC